MNLPTPAKHRPAGSLRRSALVPLLLLVWAAVPSCVSDDRRLEDLFERDWEHRLRDNPVFASRLGDRRFNDRWRNVRPEDFEGRHRYALQILEELDSISPRRLSPESRLNYVLFRKQYEEWVEEYSFGWHLVALNQRGGIQTADQLADSLPFQEVRDYEDWLVRLERFPDYMDQTIELMREGIRRTMVHPRIVMERVPAQIAAQIVEDPEDSPFFAPFRRFPDDFPEATRRELRKSGFELIGSHVVPAYRRFHRFFDEEYLPACPEGVGAWRLPRGRELYAHFARSFTTTELAPREIHEMGLREVARIREEMEEIIRGVEFEGDFEEFLDFLRTDPQFYYEDPEELLKAYRSLTRRIDPTLVRLFRRLPRIPYGVEPIPDSIAPDTTTAYYRPPAADGSRAGTYFVNLYRPEVRPKYEMEALSIHEAVPGHHLQIALAMELEGLPDFRRYTGYTAFVEGWALYAESLGEELGFYEDPYSKFGQLTYEMWRAVRLVVDTGIHDLEWTRREAIDYFRQNAAKTETDIVNEIDRYIAWPGQALAYKVGEMKLRELRRWARKELGEGFDIRSFHDAVLSLGAVPLDVLEEHVRTWTGRVQAGNRAER